VESGYLGETPLKNQTLFNVEKCVMVSKKKKKKHIGKFKKRWFGLIGVNTAYPKTLFC